MRNRIDSITFLIPAFLLIFMFVASSHAKEDFNTKTLGQRISEATSRFLHVVMNESKVNPKVSIPRQLICQAKCYIVIPLIKVDDIRKEFDGEGLLSCHKRGSKGLGPPFFYKITDIKSDYESNAGFVVLVMNEEGVSSLLNEEMRLLPDMTGEGNIGLNDHQKNPKAFSSYSKLKDGQIRPFDLSGSKLIYDARKTYDTYEDRLAPDEILTTSLPLPPRLAEFNNLLHEWEKLCDDSPE